MGRVGRAQELLIRQLAGWRGVLLAVGTAGAALLVAWSLGAPLWRAVLGAAGIGLGMSTLAALHLLDAGRTREVADRAQRRAETLSADLEAVGRQLDALDQVVADETRRPWSPTLLPWQLATLGEPRPVVVLPGADYHLPEMVELARALRRRGRDAIVACGRPHWARTGQGFVAYPDVEVFEAPEPSELRDRVGALVVMKDWEGYGRLVVAANEAGIPTFAKVEGAQDFHDVDTPEPRRPYRTAGHILCQGVNDHEALSGQRSIVGSTRLERLWFAPPTAALTELAVINLNFTYGVLTSERTKWLRTAIDGCDAAGMPFVISLHPAEKARSPHPNATAVGISRLLQRATVLISRFSTAPFEAMARGVPFLYHNPHGERVPTFATPDGAFDVTTDAAGIAAGIERAREERGQPFRERSRGFFARQVDVDPARRSEERAADVVLGALG